jgi:hypothetical protein
MADTKITALTAIGANPIIPSTFPIPMVDLTDTSMAASGTTKKVTVNQILGAGGTATFASATITGDLTVDTSILKVDSTNNRVGIGTASPSAYALHVSAPFASSKAGLLVEAGEFNQKTLVVNNSNSGVTSNLFEVQKVGTAQFLVDASGNVGIGVTPSAWNSSYRAIEIAKTGNSIFSNNASNNNILFTQNAYYDGSWKYGYTALAAHYEIQNGAHKWNTAASGTAGNTISWTQAMTLDASGNLLVGTTAMPSGVTYARLVAKSTSADWSGVIWNSNATPYGFRIQHDTDSNGTGNEFLYCLGSTNLRASIRSNGGLANYQANDVNLSDIRTKTDIKPLASYWNKIKSLELVTFKYKDQTHNDDNIGLIAQQVESVAPELVDVDGFGETPSDGVPLKTIYTTDLYHASIKALQEAMTRIEALEAKLA